ncbi:extracellular solute-binding protein [Acuticoccus sp. MNP-M23]|uniref:extracellular solute-binding protein n=1 Tax=Acuticoccus sp. MNP-M23 TaxID=3072793 RepID=UPI00281616F0|nr:extracellular solute-binding protein [Acuticoccus sp. MNP-M23]WMS41364.1 extracellular solute-binding protein [Acuticoccus sp. MNP-M23]
MDLSKEMPTGDLLPRDDTPAQGVIGQARVRQVMTFLGDLGVELDALLELEQPNPRLKILSHLMLSHLEGRQVTPSSAIAASGVPYATATRRLAELVESGLIDQRAKTKSGKSFTLHPSETLIDRWDQLASRVPRLAARLVTDRYDDYFFGASYNATRTIGPVPAIAEPLQLAGGLRILVHGDPTFMVMGNLKRQFQQIIGTEIHQRAFSIDRLREEALRNAERRQSRYDIIAVDLPWIGEFAERGVLAPLDDFVETAKLDPPDFHTAGWQASHWGDRPYGVPVQTTPEVLFYRRDLFAEAGFAPPQTTDELLAAARHFHKPDQGRYGIAWNGARGTALGHQFMMICADFGATVIDLPKIAGGFNATHLEGGSYHGGFDAPEALEAAEYMLELLRYSPPEILSMSWYERVRPYGTGKVPMAFGYTLVAPYFDLDPDSPAHGKTGYLPHPAKPGRTNVAPVGGYVLGIPTNLAPERREAVADALVTFTSPEAQKLYVLNGSRTVPRYSVSADPEVRRLSPIFEAIEGMSWRDELQFWPRPPIPQISEIIRICGEGIHDMLRGLITAPDALARIQERTETTLATSP